MYLAMFLVQMYVPMVEKLYLAFKWTISGVTHQQIVVILACMNNDRTAERYENASLAQANHLNLSSNSLLFHHSTILKALGWNLHPKQVISNDSLIWCTAQSHFRFLTWNFHLEESQYKMWQQLLNHHHIAPSFTQICIKSRNSQSISTVISPEVL